LIILRASVAEFSQWLPGPFSRFFLFSSPRELLEIPLPKFVRSQSPLFFFSPPPSCVIPPGFSTSFLPWARNIFGPPFFFNDHFPFQDESLLPSPSVLLGRIGCRGGGGHFSLGYPQVYVGVSPLPNLSSILRVHRSSLVGRSSFFSPSLFRLLVAKSVSPLFW